jgi:hypothetical protein
MSRVVVAASLAAVLVACASSVPLDRAGADRFRSASSIRVAWVPAGGAEVECPSDEGVKTWEYPGSRREVPVTPSGGPVRLATAGLWESIVGQWTESVRVPPVDPALATARAFLGDARGIGAGAWTGDPVELRDGAPARIPGADLVLVVEARRFVLLGCYFRFSPWFDARATLVDPSSGRVLWRASCGDDVRPGAGPEAWPSELAADGGALYARRIEARARACAAHLAREFLAETGRPPGPT